MYSSIVPVLPASGQSSALAASRGPTLHDASQQVGHHECRVGAERFVRLGTILDEDVALAIGDRHHRIGFEPHALIGERGVGARHLDERGFSGAERQRQVWLVVALQAETLGVADDFRRPDLRHRFHGRECCATARARAAA